MLNLSKAESARTAGEKTKDVPLMHWSSTTIRDPVQNLPDEFRPLATEPTSTSICLSCATSGSVHYKTKDRKRILGLYIAP